MSEKAFCHSQISMISIPNILVYKKCVLPFLQEFQSIDSLNSHGHLPWFHFCFELQKQQHMDWQ